MARNHAVVDTPIAAALIASSVGLLASLTLDWWRRRNDYVSRWDTQRLDAFSEFLVAVGGTLKSADTSRALHFRLKTAELYERVMLLGSSDVVAAADAARGAALRYARALGEADDHGEELHYAAFTEEGERTLTAMAYAAQQEGFTAVGSFVAAARQQLRVGELDAPGAGSRSKAAA